MTDISYFCTLIEKNIKIYVPKANIDFSKSKSYLFSTAYKLVCSSFRHLDVEKRYAKDVQMNSSINIEDSYESRECLYAMLENIPEVQKSALILKDIEGYSYKEIANILKLSIQQVEVYIFRARVALKKRAMENNLV